QAQQNSPAFQLALRKNANDFAIGKSLRSGADRSERMAEVNWDAAERTQDRVQNRFMIIRLVDDVADRTRTGKLQDESVYPADVIGYEKKAPAGEVFHANRIDAIKAPHEQPAEKIEHAFSAGHGRHRLSFTIGACQTA